MNRQDAKDAKKTFLNRQGAKDAKKNRFVSRSAQFSRHAGAGRHPCRHTYGFRHSPE
ncbi:MAG: hypothetical protein ABR544_08890 [Gammaproteobacteria bacterium]